MLRSAFVSLFWSVILHKRQSGKFTLQSLADALSRSKSVVSRWFSPELPNWEVDTIADIADALNLDLEIRAKERTTNLMFGPSGAITHLHGSQGGSANMITTTSEGSAAIAQYAVINGRIVPSPPPEPTTEAA